MRNGNYVECTVCGNTDFEIYANESLIVPLCKEHRNRIDSEFPVELVSPECKACGYVAKCCRTRV